MLHIYPMCGNFRLPQHRHYPIEHTTLLDGCHKVMAATFHRNVATTLLQHKLPKNTMTMSVLLCYKCSFSMEICQFTFYKCCRS